MDIKLKYLIKNTGILAISNFSSKFLILLLVPLYTRALSTAEYGLYDLIMSTIQVFIPFFTINIVDSVLRFMMDKNVKSDEVKCIGLKYVFLSNIYFFILLFVNHYCFKWTILKEYEIYTLLYFFFYIFNQLFIQTAKGQEQIKDLGIAGIISTIVSLCANIILLIVIPMGLKGFFCSYILGQAVSAFYLSWKTKFFKELSIIVNRQLQKEMLAYSIPLIWGNMGWFVNNVSDRYVVTWMCGVSANGIYSISYKIPTIITTLQNIFMQAWTISAIKEYGKDGCHFFYQKTFVYLNGIMTISCSLLILCTKYIARILYAKDFYPAWKYVPFLLVSVVFGAAAGFIGPILSAEKNPEAIAKSTIYGAAVNFILNIVLVYIIGAQGAAIATAISNAVIYKKRIQAIENFLYNKHYIKITITWCILGIQALLMVLDVSAFVQFPLIFLVCFIYKDTLKTILLKCIIALRICKNVK